MATYPGSIELFAGKNPRTDNVDPVMAADVNLLYAEVSAIETAVGVSPATTPSWSGDFDGTTTSWGTLTARVANLEKGVKAAIDGRVKTAGGSTIQPSATSVTGLVFRSITSQTANLLEIRDTANTLVTSVGPSGHIATIDGGTA